MSVDCRAHPDLRLMALALLLRLSFPSEDEGSPAQGPAPPMVPKLSSQHR